MLCDSAGSSNARLLHQILESALITFGAVSFGFLIASDNHHGRVASQSDSGTI